jgi:hypothetical protein
MTTQRSRRQLPTDGDPPRIQPLLVDHAVEAATPNHAHDDDQVEADPSLARHGLRQLRAPGSNLGQTMRHRGHGGRPRRPRHPSRAHACPTATLHDLISVGHSGCWKARTPDAHTGHRTPEAGHWTRGRSDTRTGYRTCWTATRGTDTGRSHRTPTRTGRRQHSGRPDLLGLLAERPHAGCPAVFLLSPYQAAAGSLNWPGRASAHCSPQTNAGRA